MNREQISRIAHADHPIASPLNDTSVRTLLEHGLPWGEGRVLDLGCGGGEWLMRALARYPHLKGEGVDTSQIALEDAREEARLRGMAERLTFHHGDAKEFVSLHKFDVVMCVGATHAFGGLLETLEVARRYLAPGGSVVIGDGYWEREPSSEAVEMLGDFGDLPTVMDRIAKDGWAPVHGHISTRLELDDYEWAWTGSLTSWALDNPDDPDAPEALAAAGVHRREWLTVYRESFGFVTLVLRQT